MISNQVVVLCTMTCVFSDNDGSGSKNDVIANYPFTNMPSSTSRSNNAFSSWNTDFMSASRSNKLLFCKISLEKVARLTSTLF